METTLTTGCRLANLLLEGRLATIIRDERAAGASWERLARHLWSITNGAVDVTSVTLRTWAVDLGVENDEDAA